jgi:hypothetical protein
MSCEHSSQALFVFVVTASHDRDGNAMPVSDSAFDCITPILCCDQFDAVIWKQVAYYKFSSIVNQSASVAAKSRQTSEGGPNMTRSANNQAGFRVEPFE